MFPWTNQRVLHIHGDFPIQPNYWKEAKDLGKRKIMKKGRKATTANGNMRGATRSLSDRGLKASGLRETMQKSLMLY